MKSLHAIQTHTTTLFWFGQGYRCGDDYHNGYNDERTETSDHNQCAGRQWTAMGFLDTNRPNDFSRCTCRFCYSDQTAHYFPVWYSLRDPQNDETGTIRCDNCFIEEHPVPPQGTT